ncbi:hypothetical protein PIB30_017282 [Stylosanthes scabra]|uniref:Uncharacterized protein n=1 Tax=Stylosanthes scabra TaxID=79078 RepID=A0ABU6R7V2_9FABA|nr:hypothetical protein [Stylosanthes scabra]
MTWHEPYGSPRREFGDRDGYRRGDFGGRDGYGSPRRGGGGWRGGYNGGPWGYGDRSCGNNNDLTQAVDESNGGRGFGGRSGYGGPRRAGGGWRGGYDGSPWGYGDGLHCSHGCCFVTSSRLDV